MDPSVQINRKSREMIYTNANVANEREEKRLSIELKKIEGQQQREMIRCEKNKCKIKNSLSMPSLLTEGSDSPGLLSPPISPRAPSSLPVSPVTSPWMSRRRHSEIVNPPGSSFLNDYSRQKRSNSMDSLKKSKSEEQLDQQAKEFTERVIIKGVTSPRILRRSWSGSPHPQGAQPLITCKMSSWSRRRLSAGCVPLRPIDENRNNLEQRIQKFHNSIKMLKGEDVVEENDVSKDTADFNNVPKLPDINPNTKRSRSLPSLIPRLSLANLKCESSSRDDNLGNPQRCRYLRIRDDDVLGTDEVFSKSETKRA